MPKVQFTRNSAGIAALLKSPKMAAAVKAKAEQVEGNLRAQGNEGIDGSPIDTVVDTYTTDRAAASVTILDANGKLLQVRDGALTKAAAAAGLELAQMYTTKSGNRRRASAAQIANWTKGRIK